jgi:hypothetical protein
MKLGFFLEITVIGIASTLIVKDGDPRLFDIVVQVPPLLTITIPEVIDTEFLACSARLSRIYFSVNV